MITGIVSGDREARVRITVLGVRSRRASVDAVIDTGFDDFLSLPPELIDRLRLPWDDRRSCILADGSESVFDVYSGTVLWDGKKRRIAIHAADGVPLLGMSLMADYVVRINVWKGGRVMMRRRP